VLVPSHGTPENGEVLSQRFIIHDHAGRHCSQSFEKPHSDPKVALVLAIAEPSPRMKTENDLRGMFPGLSAQTISIMGIMYLLLRHVR
jgi:hypothetical protein